MTRRDYVLLADAMRAARQAAATHPKPELLYPGIQLAARMLCVRLRDANGRFDEAEFLRNAEDPLWQT